MYQIKQSETRLTRGPLLWCAIVLLLSLSSCAVATAGLALWMWPTVRRIDAASAALLLCRYQDSTGIWRGNPNCVQSLFQSIGGSVRTSAGAVAKAAPEISTSLRASAAESVIASKHTSALMLEGTGAVQDARKILQREIPAALDELKTAIGNLNNEVTVQGHLLRIIEADTDKSINAATGALDQMAALEATLRKEIEALDPKAQATLDAMLVLAQSEHWMNTLAHIDAGTGSGAEILDSLDRGTRWMRQKAAVVKAVLLKLLGLVKIVFSPF